MTRILYLVKLGQFLTAYYLRNSLHDLSKETWNQARFGFQKCPYLRFYSCWWFWGFSCFWHHRESSSHVWYYFGRVSKPIEYRPSMNKTGNVNHAPWDSLRLLETSMNSLKLPKTSRDCLRLFEIPWEFKNLKRDNFLHAFLKSSLVPSQSDRPKLGQACTKFYGFKGTQ